MLKQTTAILAALLISGVNLKSAAALAGVESIDTAAQSSIQIHLSSQKDSAIRLEVRQAPLAKILKELAEKTGAIVHYSVLPEAPVTATCVGANVWQLMDCLVAKQVGLVANKPESNQPAEFWLLGSSVGSCQAMTIEPVGQPEQTSDTQIIDEAPTMSSRERSDALLAQLKNAKSPQERTEALANLVPGAIIDDPNVRKAINDAALDTDANTRAQAISTLANLDKEGAAEVLANALHDSDATVRLTAVAQSSGNVDALKQALADSDAGVRDFAAAKLAAIKQREERITKQREDREDR